MKWETVEDVTTMKFLGVMIDNHLVALDVITSKSHGEDFFILSINF